MTDPMLPEILDDNRNLNFSSMRTARFGMQALISMTIIGFCMYEISEGEKSPVYYSLISGIAGLWLS